MNIGELARKTGVSTKTVRYYEEIGVLPEAERSSNGYRTYETETVKRLRFVKDAQLTGLTLNEITSILEQRGRGESTCEHVMHLLDQHLDQLGTRIATLQKTRRELAVIATRAHRLDPSECLDPNRCQTIVPRNDEQDGDRTITSELHHAPRGHHHSH